MTGAEISDEPERVSQLITNFLSGQSGSELTSPDAPSVTLTVGADGRDDCAVYDITGPASVVVGSDYVRGPKFILHELGLLSDFDIGYYLVAANVSDIAAMGASPLGVLTVVRYPPEMTDEQFASVMAGIHQGCTDFGTLNVGGDIGNAERLILSGSALGVCQSGRALTRDGAEPGELLCVTGPCGLLGAAVAYFPQRDKKLWSLPTPIEERLLDSWRRPVARVAEGRVLSTHSFATACQDTSDGLKATIEQLGQASGVGFDVDADAVPIDDAVTAVADLMGVDALALAMSASSDFQLAFTLGSQQLDACRGAFYDAGLDFHVIGESTADPAVRARTSAGAFGPLPGVAWRHQKTDISSLVTGTSTAPPAR